MRKPKHLNVQSICKYTKSVKKRETMKSDMRLEKSPPDRDNPPATSDWLSDSRPHPCTENGVTTGLLDVNYDPLLDDSADLPGDEKNNPDYRSEHEL